MNICPVCELAKPRHKPKKRICRECYNTRERERAHRKRIEDPTFREREREKDRRYRQRHPEKMAAKSRKYRAENAERVREYENHRYHTIPRVREGKIRRACDRVKHKRKTDREFRLHDTLRCAVYMAIRRGDGAKAHRTSHYLGYPLARLVEWAAANNYNPPQTHIDHIVPIVEWRRRYPGDIVAQMRGAWNLANLRVISAYENLRKGGRVEVLA